MRLQQAEVGVEIGVEIGRAWNRRGIEVLRAWPCRRRWCGVWGGEAQRVCILEVWYRGGEVEDER